MQNTPLIARYRPAFRRVVLFGTPVLLSLLELGHPLLDHRNTIHMLAPIVTWWIVLHLLLVPLFALMGWTFFLLLDDMQSPAATLSRYATVVYISFTIGYDMAVGLVSGILVGNAVALPTAQQNVVQQALQQLYTYPAIGLSYLILLGAGIVAIGSAAWAFARAGVPAVPIVILLGTVLAAYSHALPFGPLGDACFFLAALWIELVWRPSSRRTSQPLGRTNASLEQSEPVVNVSGGGE